MSLNPSTPPEHSKDSTPRRRPSQKRSRATFDAITESAQTLIGSLGLDAVTMQMIADTANMPISRVYRYFPNKVAILTEVMDAVWQSFDEVLEEAVSGRADTEELIEAVVAALQSLYDRALHDAYFANLLAATSSVPELKGVYVDGARRRAERVAQYARPFVTVSDEDAALRTYTLLATLRSLGIEAPHCDETFQAELADDLERLTRETFSHLCFD